MKIFKLFKLFYLSYELFKYDLAKKDLKGFKLEVQSGLSSYQWIKTKNELCFNHSPYEVWKRNEADELILFLKAKLGYE